jgi:hypothetical protein
MAGMFYTLQEVIEKLGKTEAEIKTFVREGKLREFRDGAKQLYKTEDVDALVGSAKGDTAVLSDSLAISIDEAGDVSLAPEELDALMGSEDNKGKEPKFELDETGELMAEETLGGTPKGKTNKPKTDDEILLSPAVEGTKAQSDSISIAGDTAKQGSALTDEDTRISGGGDSINVLGESDTDFKITNDTSSETKLMQKKPKALDEKGGDKDGQRLDDDVNLDAGGSGSGLLDLSLQADDTSLGAVLDDIYPENAGGSPSNQSPTAGGAVVAEAENILEQAEPAAIGGEPVPQETTAQGAVAMAMVVEPPPDASSNIFGLTLFVPLIVLIYTAIVVSASYKPILNLQILSAVEPIIWYVVGGIAAAVILMVLIGSVAGGPKRPKAPKAPKEPKVKKVKPPKEKKVKKGKEQPPAKA